ncbi:MAG TPA: adenylate/guanylate cyclase domain-containing protein [Methylomirabilota bacterium]|nr:adenylate/guanylate cyclase domain-containing protein [Methylomirabilota bacterium]
MPAIRTHVMTDIKDYGRLMHEAGEAEATRRLRIYERIVRERLPRKSTEVDHIADGFHLIFTATREALQTAIDIAEALSTHTKDHPDAPLPTAIGIDTGESLSRGGRYFGPAPVTAARLASRGHGGQVLVTATVKSLLPSAAPLRDLGVWRSPDGPSIRVYEARPPDPTSTPARSERFLAALLFTDIVRSTATAAAMGDRQWRELVERHNAIVRKELARFGGNEIDTAGDGFYASFDAPSHAIECARALRESMKSTGLAIRVGIHVGECEMVGGKIGGLTVTVGARIKETAEDGEILVSRTVRDLVIGTGFTFAERGPYELKGIPGRWELYELTA